MNVLTAANLNVTDLFITICESLVCSSVLERSALHDFKHHSWSSWFSRHLLPELCRIVSEAVVRIGYRQLSLIRKDCVSNIQWKGWFSSIECYPVTCITLFWWLCSLHFNLVEDRHQWASSRNSNDDTLLLQDWGSLCSGCCM